MSIAKASASRFTGGLNLGLLIASLGLCCGLLAAEDTDVRLFESKVRPLLAEKCSGCHGPEKQKGGLRTDHREHLLKGGDSGAAIVPGDPEKSLLISAIRRTDEDFSMPPKAEDALSETEVAILVDWIKAGAIWPADGDQRVEARDAEGFTQEERGWWAFQRVEKPEVPTAGEGWAKNEIDRFVAATLEMAGLEPAPEASEAELARRISFGLTGLPPLEGQVTVEEFLASSHYGERWAQHWLDVVRYSESDGYRADDYRPHVWRYRDWVVDAFNADMPYDRFVQKQLAGDEIAPDDPDTLIATAFLRHGVYEWNQRDARGQWEIILNEVTDVTGDTFLGLSMACARCHNHKFDPILQKDYFRLKAFFTPIWWRDDLPLATSDQISKHQSALAEWEKENEELLCELDELTRPGRDRGNEYATKIFPDDVEAMIRKSADERAPFEQQLASLSERQLRREAKKQEASKLSAPEKKRYAELIKEIGTTGRPGKLPEAFVTTDVGSKAPPTWMKTRAGQVDVAPGFPTVIAGANPAAVQSLNSSTGRRTALAEWITDDTNPLTARVIVNRVWQYHFGRGLVATTSDFGTLGEKPSHPELLDWLAHHFVHELEWSFKDLHRLILSSATYRQTARRSPSSELVKSDPENTLLWRFPPRRLDGAEIRDAILASTGSLDRRMGGPSIDGKATRRSLYVKKRRNTPDPFLGQFDTPGGFGSMPKRDTTTTPGQSLTLLNSSWVIAQASRLAAEIRRLPADEQITALWKRIHGEPPTAEEMARAEQFLNQSALAEEQTTTSRSANREYRDPFEAKGARRPAATGITVEAVVQLDSLYEDAKVRVILSRHNGNMKPTSEKDHGWSLGITSKKSAYDPRNLIVQLVGRDAEGTPRYEVVASDLRAPLGVPIYIGVEINAHPVGEDGSTGTVRFVLKDLSKPDQPTQEKTVNHKVVGFVEQQDRPLVIGGRQGQMNAHRFDGELRALRIAKAKVAMSLPANPSTKLKGADDLIAKSVWIRGAPQNGGGHADPRERALSDLAQILFSSNRFLYLH